jgi:hypothetical protein
LPDRSIHSVLAGCLTAAILLALNFQLFSSTSRPSWIWPAVASLALALGIALWRPIRPDLYAFSLACSFFALAVPVFFMAAGSNLFGLVVLAGGGVIALGLLLCGAVALVAPPLRRLDPPPWVAAAVASVGALTLLAASARQLKNRTDDSLRILDRVQEIRRAELSYADSSPDHAFTCNGPDLPGLASVSWSVDQQLGGRELNRAHLDGHWIYLRCAPSARPQSLNIQVISPDGPPFQLTVSR